MVYKRSYVGAESSHLYNWQSSSDKSADGEIMTPTRWHADCTYCPFYDVWRDMGDGQRLGWLFDEELHPALYQAYHPGIQVKFVSNKNRGNQVCGFRLDIVEGEACTEAILTIRPADDRLKCGTPNLVVRKSERRLTPMMRSQSATVNS